MKNLFGGLSFIFMVSAFLPPALATDFGLPPVELRRGQLAEGSLFSVKYLPGKRNVSFFITGKKAGEFSLSDLKMNLYLKNQPQAISLKRQGDRFVYEDTLPPGSHLEIVNKNGEKETFKVERNP